MIFSGVTMTNAKFNGCKWGASHFDKAELTGAIFNGCSFDGGNFNLAILNNAEFHNCSFTLTGLFFNTFFFTFTYKLLSIVCKCVV